MEERAYGGETTTYRLRPEGSDAVLEAVLRNAPGRPLHEPGAKVQLAWDPSAFLFFK